MSWSPALTSDDLEPFNNLVHAANVAEDFTGSNPRSSPPTPSENFWVPSESSKAVPTIPSHIAHAEKLDSWERLPIDLQDHEILFRQPYDATFDSSS